MKTVNKIILASCVFCYFAGIFIIAVKMGIIHLISQYGLSRCIDEWPADIPSLNFVLVFFVIYTVIFALITYVIYKNVDNHGKDMDELQQKTSIIHNYSDDLSTVVARYNRICRKQNVNDKSLSQRLLLLEKKVSSLTASVLDNRNAGNKIARMISEIDDAVSRMESNDYNVEQLKNIVECAIEDVQRLQKSSISIK